MKDVELKLGNNGIVLNIADNQGKHQGKLRIGQATVEWYGKTRMGNGKKIRVTKFVDILNEQ